MGGTTFHGDLMWITEESLDGQTWYVAWEGREVDGLLEERSPVFRTSRAFWEVGNHEWETNGVRSRASYDAEWEGPEWQASGWTV